jgi:IMP dehydrogenase
MVKTTSHVSRAFSEFVILPNKTRADTRISDVSLRSRITHNIDIPLPLMSAAMQSVTGHNLAIALAQQGGIGVLPASVPVEEQVNEVRAVKRYKAGFMHNPITVSPDDMISKLLKIEMDYGYSTFPVVDNGRLVGMITEKRYHPEKDLDVRVSERMIPQKDLIIGNEGITLEEANDMLCKLGIGALPVVDKKMNLKSVVFYQDLKHHTVHPDAFVDKEKRLRVAAAVSTHPEDSERARMLVSSGVDFLVIDSSDIHSEFAEQAMEGYRKLGVPIIAGNIVDSEAFVFLAGLGAEAVKIGQGSGSICTTRRVKSVGRGQATAVMRIAEARNRLFNETGKYIPIISDGGIESSGNMAVAFALGADLIMMGKYFAGFTESPTEVMTKTYNVMARDASERISQVNAYVKPYWGEASPKAKNLRRYGHNDPRTFVIEGEEGYVLHKGNLSEQLPVDVLAVKASLSASGCRNLAEFRDKARLEIQTGESYRESGTNILK